MADLLLGELDACRARLIGRYGLQPADVEDVIHDAVAAALYSDRLAEMKPECGRLYFWGIVKNKAADHLRRHHRHRGAEVIDDDALRPIRKLNDRLSAAEYLSVLQQLPREQREALFLRYSKGWPVDSIAQEMGMKPARVYYVLKSALNGLRLLI